MALILRGDVYWTDLDPTQGHEQAGRRPVLILSHDVFNERSGTAIVVVFTSQPQQAGFPLTLALESTELPKNSWVKISQIRILSTKRLSNRIGRATPEEVSLVIEGLNEIIGDKQGSLVRTIYTNTR